MKKIIPFNNILTFDTDVCEITAISLEHAFTKTSDEVSGEFYVTGEYKMTDGQLDKEKFSFTLPFDVALGCDYNLDTLIFDIDDFRYELIDRNHLKINIDMYIDGEVIEPPAVSIPKTEDELFTEDEFRELKASEEEPKKADGIGDTSEEEITEREETAKEDVSEVCETFEPERVNIGDNLDLLDEMLGNKKEEKMVDNKKDDIDIENNNINTNTDVNIFNGFNEKEEYVTYHVYPVTENDSLEKIMEKYDVTKEELSKYNNIEDIKTGDKLIIPAVKKND